MGSLWPSASSNMFLFGLPACVHERTLVPESMNTGVEPQTGDDFVHWDSLVASLPNR